jgi:putative SOS response-associated peptidase YedK
MCGRYATTRNSADLTALFEAIDETDGTLAPDYNVAPTDPVPIVRMSRRLGSRALSVARWGLVPPWADDPKVGARMINARAETVATSSAYASSFARRRCLVPADGWYEWIRQGRSRQPYFMTTRDGSPLVFAGLWTVWGAGAERRLTCSVITSAAVGDLAMVHDRMPLVLPRDRWDAWLAGPADVPDLLAPTPEPFVASLEIRPIGRAVGDVRNDGPQLVARVDAQPLGVPPDEPVALRLF